MSAFFNRVIGPRGVVVEGLRLHCEEMNGRVGQMVTLKPLKPPVFGEMRAYFKDGHEANAVAIHIGDWLSGHKGKHEALHRKLSRRRKDIPHRRPSAGK